MRIRLASIIVLVAYMFGCGGNDSSSVSSSGTKQRDNERELSDIGEELDSTITQTEDQSGVQFDRDDPGPTQRATVELIKSLGGDCLTNSEEKITTIIVYEFKEPADSALKKLANLDGLDSLNSLVLYDERVTDVGIQHVGKLKSITYLALPSKITADGFESLTTLSRLNALAYNRGKITDEVVTHITSFQELQTLALSTSNITDNQLKLIASLKKLEHLVLDGTPISDTGLGHLQSCKSLKMVSIEGTRVTVGGVEQLKKALPEAEVLWRKR